MLAVRAAGAGVFHFWPHNAPRLSAASIAADAIVFRQGPRRGGRRRVPLPQAPHLRLPPALVFSERLQPTGMQQRACNDRPTGLVKAQY